MFPASVHFGETTVAEFTRPYEDETDDPEYTYFRHKEGRSEIYEFDALHRLTRYRRGKLDLSVIVFEQDWHDTGENQTLDKLGNWDAVRQQPEGGEMATITRGHNAANEYTSLNGQSAYGHDRNGNMTDDGTYTFSYDFANHLVRAVRQDGGDTVGEYHYDALGRRVRKVVDDVSDTLDGTTLFYYDGMRVIEEGRLDGSSNYRPTHQYVWGLQYLDELILYDFDADGDGDFDAIDEEEGDKRYYCYHDYLYSVIGVGTAAGEVVERYDYEPYGKVTIWDGDYADTRAETHVHLDFLFTGQRYDAETALYHYKTRAYQSPFGRFASPDLVDYAYGMNLYEYVNSMPILMRDPFGTCPYGYRVATPADQSTWTSPIWEEYRDSTLASEYSADKLSRYMCGLLTVRSTPVKCTDTQTQCVKQTVEYRRLDTRVESWRLDGRDPGGDAWLVSDRWYRYRHDYFQRRTVIHILRKSFCRQLCWTLFDCRFHSVTDDKYEYVKTLKDKHWGGGAWYSNREMMRTFRPPDSQPLSPSNEEALARPWDPDLVPEVPYQPIDDSAPPAPSPVEPEPPQVPPLLPIPHVWH